MILSCPSCATRYTIDESQLGPAGRTVRCTACKTTWHAEKPEIPIDLSFSDVRKPERVEDLQSVKAKVLPHTYRALIEDKKRAKALTAQGLVWAGLGSVAVLILAIGFFLRVDIVSAFPSVAGAYAMVGAKVNPTHLDFVTTSMDRGVKGGRFVVTVKAQIRNTSDKPVPVPPVRVKLRDTTLQQFDTVLMPAGGLVVGPGATRTLLFDVRDPMNKAAAIDLDFDLVAMKKMKSHSAPHAAADENTHEPASEDGEAEHGNPEQGAEPATEASPVAENMTDTGHGLDGDNSVDGGDSVTQDGGAQEGGAQHDAHDQPVSNRTLPSLRPALHDDIASTDTPKLHGAKS